MDDEDFESEVEVEYTVEFITNDDWPSTAMRFHPLDLAVTVCALAANVSTAFSVFFADVRRDLAHARNRELETRFIKDFDDALLGVASTDGRQHDGGAAAP